MKTIFRSARHHYMAGLSIFLVVATLMAGLAGCGGSRPAVNAIEIGDWYDLSAIANNMSADYVLENDLDATTDGWEELASPTANEGKGWKPIAAIDKLPDLAYFSGIFDGQGHEIKDLFINRPDELRVGLFLHIHLWGVIRNIGVVNANVTGGERVGGLVGQVTMSTVSNSYFIGSVNGFTEVGGLAGFIWDAAVVSDSYSTGSVTGDERVGGLIGENQGIVSDSYYTGNVTGNYLVGGLAGISLEATSNCYATGDVTGDERVGGLVGGNQGTISNSYSTCTVTGNYLVGGLAGISFNLTSNCYASGNVTGGELVGGLLGNNQGTVSACYSTGNVTGEASVGGLVGLGDPATVISSFWDIETSGLPYSDGGTGKNTTEMQDIVTFHDAGWSIIGVGNSDQRNPAYIWNIVDMVTYPFLSW